MVTVARNFLLLWGLEMALDKQRKGGTILNPVE